jgi:hypothetical protein
MGNRMIRWIAVGCLAWFAAAGAIATPLCSVTDASANGSFADACSGPDDVDSAAAAQLGYVNTTFGGGFTSIGKTGDSFIPGWDISVTEGDGSPWDFLFTVTSPISGSVVDFVLLIKQAQETLAYLFENVTLDIDGSWISTFTGPQGQPTVDFSHVAGFYRPGAVPVPAPAPLGLLAIALFGIAAFRRIRAG